MAEELYERGHAFFTDFVLLLAAKPPAFVIVCTYPSPGTFSTAALS